MNYPRQAGTARSVTDDWAGIAGRRGLSNLGPLEAMLAPIARDLLLRAGFAPGERGVDIGCGGGLQSLQISRAVGPTGSVVGVDIASDLVATATERARQAGASNLQFIVGNAETTQLPSPHYDRLFSQFGTLYFQSPSAGYANLARMLRPGGGRGDFAVWGPPEQNGCAGDVMRVVDGYIDLPPPVSRAPGPFGFSDPDYITSLRGGAGFGRGDLVPWRGVLAVGGPGLCPSDAVRFTARIMDFDRLLDRVAATARARLRDERMQLFAAHHSPGERVRMPAMTWLVAAQR